MTTTVLSLKPKTGRRHWHPLIDAAIQMGGIRPEKDKATGRLADEYQWLKDMPGLLNKRGLALDEMARCILEEFPEVAGHIDTDSFDGNLYPEDLRYALECAMRREREEEPEEIAPEPELYREDFTTRKYQVVTFSFE